MATGTGLPEVAYYFPPGYSPDSWVMNSENDPRIFVHLDPELGVYRDTHNGNAVITDQEFLYVNQNEERETGKSDDETGIDETEEITTAKAIDNPGHGTEFGDDADQFEAGKTGTGDISQVRQPGTTSAPEVLSAPPAADAIRYNPQDLEAWVSEMRQHTSTDGFMTLAEGIDVRAGLFGHGTAVNIRTREFVAEQVSYLKKIELFTQRMCDQLERISIEYKRADQMVEDNIAVFTNAIGTMGSWGESEL